MNEINKKIYDVAIDILNNKFSKSEGIEKLVFETNMNKGSAHMVMVQIFPKFFNGERFTRTLNVKLFDDLLNFVLKDYGFERLGICLNAIKQHIDYIQTKGDSKIKLRKVYQKYLDLISDLKSHELESITDEKEQAEIANHFKIKVNRNELINELKLDKGIEDEEVIINLKRYKRNNKIIALIKILRNNECQICGTFILKKDGSQYVEAAHIIPKHKKGKETESNILLLCPNHHKEFDFGDLKIIEQTNEKINFLLNGTNYELKLQIE